MEQQIIDDLEELRAHGYEVRRFTNYHYRISHLEHEIEIDLFPNHCRFSVRYPTFTSKAKSYFNLVADINGIFREHEKNTSKVT